MRAETLGLDLTSTHWGAYELKNGPADSTGLVSYREDPEPSMIGHSMWRAYQSPIRVQRPAVRAGWLAGSREEHDHKAGRGLEPFVELPWDEVIDLVARELERVIYAHGNRAVFGGSYGWASAGRFHHAQSQVHRFLNVLGGYVRSVDTYSLGAGRVLLPHVVCTMEHVLANQHDWRTLAANTRLFVSFGGAPAKNAQVGAGGASHHRLTTGLEALAAAGCRFVNFSPVREDLSITGAAPEWIPIRPGTDTAVMLALACEIILANRHDRGFLERYCEGFGIWRDYLTGETDGVRRDAAWAGRIAGVSPERLRRLATELTECRSLVNVAWSLQRADHGEQPFWAAVGLASVLGQIGLPGGGFALAYGPTNTMGSPERLLPGPVLPQGSNPVSEFIPVARIADMLLRPGECFTYNGISARYPDIRLVYWAGGNPFHHHQDLHRLARAWRRPETIVVHEQFWNAHARMADIVLPATCTLERDDIGFATRDPLMIAMRKRLHPPGEARDDYAIFCAIAAALGKEELFSEGRTAFQWLEHLFSDTAVRWKALGIELPDFQTFWSEGGVRVPPNDTPVVFLGGFREDPVANPLETPSGRIELYSKRIASWGHSDCPGHPTWLEPAEWLGGEAVERFPLHLLSDQPRMRLHSQLDHSECSLSDKVGGREPLSISPEDALARGVSDGDIVRVYNDRGTCFAGARISPGLRPGVVRLSTGAWWDPEVPGDPTRPDRHGNPNTLTRDAGASSVSQGCSAQSCLVQVERVAGDPAPVQAFELPEFLSEGSAIQFERGSMGPKLT